ncbi:mitochondrial DNA helicase-like [Atheta coriaria]|uniref:mitochondrial DNA helicase-like n=1 Tax=Dalotia coriaria TaxID=877792 RepID=UPI0031F3B1A5
MFSINSFNIVNKFCKSFYKLYKTTKTNTNTTNNTQPNHQVQHIQFRSFKDVRLEDIPEVSVSTIRSKFKKYDMKFEEVYTNFIISCPMCEKQKESLIDKTKIFVNKRTGSFTCETCHHTGTWFDIESYITSSNTKNVKFKDPLVVKELNKLTQYLRNLKNNTISFKNIDDALSKQILKKFELPDIIPKSLMITLGVTVDITHTSMYFPLHNSAYDIVGHKVIRVNAKSSIEPSLRHTASSGILYHRGSKSSSTAIVVATVGDFLNFVNANSAYHVICLPNGLANLSLHVLPAFDRFARLILWFGNDLSAWETARNFSKKLGERRCSFIRNMEVVPETLQDFKNLISSAQPMWHKSITTFASLREDVLSDLQNIDRVQGIKWSRFPTLNRIVKGHRRGELTVFTGPTGSGKTTFISEYSLDLAMQGVNTLWGSFEIRNARLARTMLQQMAGIPLDEHLDQYDHWADKFEVLPIYYMTFHGQQSIKVVMEAIEHAVYVHDISHVIIDNLQFMMGMSEETRNMDRFWKQDLIVANFRTFATRRNCHVTLVIHPRKERDAEDLTMSSIFGGAKASQEADNILIIQDKRLASIKGKKYLQVCKNRYSGDLGVMPLDFDKSSLSFVSKKDKKKLEIGPKIDVTNDQGIYQTE